ncbi:hypothetical protein [Halomonas sp. GD1P12]|uniref:hypothetical protein n=1 Tax=Halomonas sp. GD1P12 TaxID=2982691 RepID=UPI0021E49A5F|nr:hypothetical protein [Halomonas sp. GD1P12]UYF99325.1 hypothetical protein OCT39_13970 [Halomonas sp. GD1P12]
MNKLTLLASAAALAATFTAGWQVSNWQNQSHALTAERAARQAIDASLARESEIAANVEARLAELTANERIIDRGIIREIQKPIYQRVCLEPDAIRLLNHAAAGTAPDSTDPDATLP